MIPYVTMTQLNDVFTVTLVSITEELKRNMNETICHNDPVKRCFTVTLVSITEELKRNMNETICHNDPVKRCLHRDAGQHNGGAEKKYE